MNMTIMRINRIDFDTYENQSSAAITFKTVLIAANDLPDVLDGKTAYAKVEDYLKTKALSSLYLGWDGEVYPKWKVLTETVV